MAAARTSKKAMPRPARLTKANRKTARTGAGRTARISFSLFDILIS
jgi:hypothetical protein